MNAKFFHSDAKCTACRKIGSLIFSEKLETIIYAMNELF